MEELKSRCLTFDTLQAKKDGDNHNKARKARMGL